MLNEMIAALGELSEFDFETQTALLNSRFAERAHSVGLGKSRVVGAGDFVVNVRGTLRLGAVSAPTGVTLLQSAIRIKVDELSDRNGLSDDGLTDHYEFEGDGAYVWLVPDGYMASLTAVEQVWARDGGGYFSHESICVLNTSETATRCRLNVYYEDTTRNNFHIDFNVEAGQSLHYRLDKLSNDDGSPMIPKDAPVSYRVTSFDRRVVVQGSRILTSGQRSEFGSFGTAMAWTPVL